jgi:hypothetical protein
MRVLLTLMLFLVCGFAAACGGGAACTMTVSQVSPEGSDGIVTIYGSFIALSPGMVLTDDEGTETALFCTVNSDDTSATCNVGGLMLPATDYQLGFGALCLSNDDAGVTNLGSAVPGTLLLH